MRRARSVTRRTLPSCWRRSLIVRVTRSGGFAGVVQEVGVLDTRTLSVAEAANLKAIIEELGRLEGPMQAAVVGADLLRYDVEIQGDQGERRHLALPQEGDPDVPPPSRWPACSV